VRGLVRLAWPLTTALICLALAALLGGELLSADYVVSKRVAARQAQAAASQKPVLLYNPEVQLLQTRWFGTPAIYQPAPIANTTTLFFDVAGVTQDELYNGLNDSGICKKYGPCAKDPANPTGLAWGLEWFQFAGGNYYTCYAPRTTTLQFREYILLPRWTPAADGSVTIDLVERWNALAQVIYIHEAGHVAISKQDLAALNAQAHRLATCDALAAFWDSSHVFDKEAADQAAYHARLRADCRPEVGCIPPYWMGW
jgi:predicted secreted Zn-dependent protease